MAIRKLALAGAAALLACGAAWGQQSKPTYEEALTAVTYGGCERADADRYIRFYCAEGEALWYFTIEGRPEHETYFVGPVRGFGGNRLPIAGAYRGGSSQSREAALERIRVHQEWMRGIIKIWQQDAERMQAQLKRDRGRLYPLEPS